MSQWTAVTGAIRFDGIPRMSDKCTVKALEKVLGSTCDFDGSQEQWKACTVPCGSEGSIQYEIIEYGKGLPWAVAVIWGDLRDYGDDKDIVKLKEWFYKVCTEWPMVRQGVLQVGVGGETIVFQHNDNKEGYV